MTSMTYLQHVQNILNQLVRDGDTRMKYERIMSKVHTRKRLAGEVPVPHHRRLTHAALMREVRAKRARVTGYNEARVVTVTEEGASYYSVWSRKKQESQPGGKSGGAALNRSRAELLLEYVRTATLLSSLRELLGHCVEASAHQEVKNLPDLVRGILQAESFQSEQNVRLSEQVLDGSLRIKSMEIELRRRGTAVTTSDVASDSVDL